MSTRLEQLQELEVQLHEVNQEFSRAAQPLYRMRDLNYQQRETIAAQLRAAESRWESVTQQISKVLATGSTPAASGQPTAESRESGCSTEW